MNGLGLLDRGFPGAEPPPAVIGEKLTMTLNDQIHIARRMSVFWVHGAGSNVICAEDQVIGPGHG